MIRVPEHNDWVVFVLLGSIAAFVFMLQYLHREASLKDFVTQSIADSGNIFPSWVLVSVIYTLLLSTLVSQFLPAVPRAVNNMSLFGFSLNKFGYSFITISVFYIIKALLSYLFFNSVGQPMRWTRYWFVSTKFYFVFSGVLIAAVFAKYFYPLDGLIFFQVLTAVLLGILMFKQVFFLLNRNGILPEEWYYKILYICTLQIAPILGLWRMLFF